MPYTPHRARSELPFAGTDIILRYSYEHPAVPFDFEDTLEEWQVNIARYYGEDACPNCPDDGYYEFAETGTPPGPVRKREVNRSPTLGRSIRQQPRHATLSSAATCVPSWPYG
jgi:hypothetical protein